MDEISMILDIRKFSGVYANHENLLKSSEFNLSM